MGNHPVHLAYDHHNNDLHYRISSAGAATVPDANFTASLFSAERNYLQSGDTPISVTYPHFVTLETSRKEVLFWREGSASNGDEYCADYKDDGTWSSRRQIVSKTGVYHVPGTCPNSNTRYGYGWFAPSGDDIHYGWLWSEDAVDGSMYDHDMMYAKGINTANTWKNTSETTLSLPITVSSDVIAWPLDCALSAAARVVPAVDSLGNTHVITANREYAGGPVQNFHYMRNAATGTWSRAIIPYGGYPFIDRTYDTLYLVHLYSDGLIRIFAAQKQP